MHAPLHPRDDPARGESQRVTVNTPYVPSIIHKLTQYLNNVFGRHANPVKIPPPLPIEPKNNSVVCHTELGVGLTLFGVFFMMPGLSIIPCFGCALITLENVRTYLLIPLFSHTKPTNYIADFDFKARPFLPTQILFLGGISIIVRLKRCSTFSRAGTS